MPEHNLTLIFAERNGCVIHGGFIRLGFSLDMTDIFFTDAHMAPCALFIGSKRILAIVTRAAISALVKRFHHEIFLFLGQQGLHFKQTAVALFATYLFYIHMVLMAKEDRFDRLGVKDAAAVGKAWLRRGADVGDAKKRKQKDQE